MRTNEKNRLFILAFHVDEQFMCERNSEKNSLIDSIYIMRAGRDVFPLPIIRNRFRSYCT